MANGSDLPVSETTSRKNQFHPEVIARREQEAAEAAAEKAAEDKIKLEQINAVMAKNRILAFNCGKPRNPLYPEIREPNPLQKQLLDAWREQKYKVFTYMGANRIGKTTLGAILAISIIRGEWPWSGEKIPFSHANPRRVAWIGQGWETHIKSVILPALKFWWPEDMPVKTKKNNQGVDATWEFWSRSHDKGLQGELQIFSTSQDVTVFEGAQYDLVIYDEPPPRDIRVACARGLVDRKGRELFCCTLLNQAWIHRDIIRATDAKGEPDPSYFNLSGDSSVNIGYGITQEGIDQFAKTLTADEYQARILGRPSYLSALVCPRFDRKTHIKERFTIPLNAVIDISIDWHPSKPLMVVFMATLSNGVKHICDEIKFRGNIKSATEEIVRVIRMRDYTRINKVIIDPLSKSGQPNDSDAFSVMEEILMPYGYALEVASKEKENGIELLNNLLWTQNECPAVYFFRDCVNSIQEVEDMMYDEDGKPMKVNDDAFECIYRLALLDTQWFEEWKNKSTGSARSVVL